jgi:hypothetical protein
MASPRSLVPLSLVLALAACGPAVELETDTGTSSTITAVSEEGTTADDVGVTTDVFEDLPTPLDLGDPGPSLCPAGAGDLVLEWGVTEPGEGRADAVAVGAGRVAWATGEFFDEQLWMLDADGNPLWNQSAPLFSGEGEASFQDLEIDPQGGLILAGTMGTEGFDALLRWFDPMGNVLAEDVLATPGFDLWQGAALLPEGDVVLAGESEGAIFVRRSTPMATEVWSRSFAEGGAVWASHVDVAPTGTIFVSGHSNTAPGPVLLAYDADGTLQWSRLPAEGGALEVGMSVAADSQGRAWLTVNSDVDDHRVERYDAAGTMDLVLPLDFRPNAIASDIDDAIVVAGAILEDELVVVERYASNGAHVARHERPGRFATGVEVDESCHAYVVGYTLGSEAWLDKLR